MRELVIEGLTGVNLEALDAELRAAPGAMAGGVSLRGEQVVVHLRAEAGAQQEAEARSLAQRHDPLALSAGQRTQEERRRQLKAMQDAALAARAQAEGAEDVREQLRLLERRVAWLEALTGG